MLHSIVEYCSEHEGYSCGYCKSPDTNFSHGLWAHAMTVSDYQDLIDRGWRRSGKYCYKPIMDMTCCPMYTIKCRALDFKASKSQKKVLKKFNKFLAGDEVQDSKGNVRKMSTGSDVNSDSENIVEEAQAEQFVESTKEPQNIDLNNIVKIGDCEDMVDEKVSQDDCKDKQLDVESLSAESVAEPNALKDVKKVTGPDPNKAPCKKAKQLRKERKLEKLKEKGIDIRTLNNSNKNKEKQLEDIIHELPQIHKQRLEVRLVRTNPPSPEWNATAKESHELYVKYQTIIHNDKPEKCTESKFKDFLVQSPLLEEQSETGPPSGFGSFHQQYWLDGKLVAVGVIDILPKCVSSVYFFYDPQYMQLTLGTYGALREIEFVRHLGSICPELKYYYMGFYIHSCRKMRYKGNFHPSDLLCPETYKWFPIQNCLPKLEASAYSRLDADIDSIDTNCPNEGVINYLPVWVKGVVMPYKMYKRKVVGKNNKEDTDVLLEYARLVGAKAAKSLILVR